MGVRFLVSRRSDGLSVCIGIRVNWYLGRRIFELRHWDESAVKDPTRAMELGSVADAFVCLNISIRSPRR